MQGMEEQVMTSAATETGSILTAECPRVEMGTARAILEALYAADRKTNWNVEIKSGTLIISCDKAPQFGYTTSLNKLGKGYTGRHRIKGIGIEMLERINAGAIVG